GPEGDGALTPGLEVDERPGDRDPREGQRLFRQVDEAHGEIEVDREDRVKGFARSVFGDEAPDTTDRELGDRLRANLVAIAQVELAAAMSRQCREDELEAAIEARDGRACDRLGLDLDRQVDTAL